MATLPERILVDTNVLVYALYEDSEHHHASKNFLARAYQKGITLCLTPQILAELYAVITDRRRVTRPRTPAAARQLVKTFLTMPDIELLPMPSDVVDQWIDLITQHPVRGSAIFDVQLVATMIGNNIDQICTYNQSDFKKFKEIKVLTP